MDRVHGGTALLNAGGWVVDRVTGAVSAVGGAIADAAGSVYNNLLAPVGLFVARRRLGDHAR